MMETPSMAPLGPLPEGLRRMPPYGGLRQSRTLWVRILYVITMRAHSTKTMMQQKLCCLKLCLWEYNQEATQSPA